MERGVEWRAEGGKGPREGRGGKRGGAEGRERWREGWNGGQREERAVKVGSGRGG